MGLVVLDGGEVPRRDGGEVVEDLLDGLLFHRCFLSSLVALNAAADVLSNAAAVLSCCCREFLRPEVRGGAASGPPGHVRLNRARC